MLVPEGFLFSTNQSDVRKLLLRDSQLSALISLPGGIFETTSIRTDIIVAAKPPARLPAGVFMARIQPDIQSDGKSSLQEKIDHVADRYALWMSAGTLESDEETWTLPEAEIIPEDWTVAHYAPSARNPPNEVPGGYDRLPLGKLVDEIKRGTSIRLIEDGDIPFVGPSVVRPMTLDLDQTGKTVKEILPSRRVSIRHGDILINNIGSYLGSAAVAGDQAAGLDINQHVIRLRVNSSIVLPEYLAVALNSEYVQKQIRQIATGSIMPSLSSNRLRDVLVPMPDLDTQRRIVHSLRQAQDNLKRAKSQLEEIEADFRRALDDPFTLGVRR